MPPLVVAPLRIEALALGARRIGMGPRAAALPDGPVVVAGLCGAVDPSLRAGDVIVATELRRGSDVRPADPEIADRLRAHGLTVRTGPIVSSERILGPAEREALRGAGALAVDMESFWLADRRRVAVVRVVVDEAGRRLLHPRTLVAGLRALRTLRRVGRALSSA